MPASISGIGAIGKFVPADLAAAVRIELVKDLGSHLRIALGSLAGKKFRFADRSAAVLVEALEDFGGIGPIAFALASVGVPFSHAYGARCGKNSDDGDAGFDGCVFHWVMGLVCWMEKRFSFHIVVKHK